MGHDRISKCGGCSDHFSPTQTVAESAWTPTHELSDNCLLTLATMATTETDIIPSGPASNPHIMAANALADSLAKTAIQDEASQQESGGCEKTTPSPRPMRIYTRSQILFLHNSPLVRPPPNMPDLKDWFGYDASTA